MVVDRSLTLTTARTTMLSIGHAAPLSVSLSPSLSLYLRKVHSTFQHARVYSAAPNMHAHHLLQPRACVPSPLHSHAISKHTHSRASGIKLNCRPHSKTFPSPLGGYPDLLSLPTPCRIMLRVGALSHHLDIQCRMMCPAQRLWHLDH